MNNPQILIKAGTYGFDEIERTARSLVRRNRKIWCIGSAPEDAANFRKLKIEPVCANFVTDGTTDLVIVAPPVVFDRGALARLARRARGLHLLRVLIPGKDPDDGVSYWTQEFLWRNPIAIGILANADIDFDAELLPNDNSHARHWVRGADLGVEINHYSGVVAQIWRYLSTFRNNLLSAVKFIRRLAGKIKRRFRSRAHRRLALQLSRR